MFCILLDSKTKTYYMRPKEVCFFAYSDPSKFEDDFEPSARLVETEFDTFKELSTELFNAGFTYGFLDGKEIQLSKSDAYYIRKNANEIAFVQYLLTKDERYLKIIRKTQLLTVCKIEGNQILFPIVRLDDGKEVVLTYTDKSRIPPKFLEMYKNWRIVRMTYQSPCIVNETFIAE